MTLTAGEASQKLGARLVGDSSFLIEGVSAPESATPNTACFVESSSYLPAFKTSQAKCWLMNTQVYESLDDKLKSGGRVFLLSDKPYHSFVKLVGHFHPVLKAQGRVSEKAFVDPTATVHPTAQIEAFVSVGARAKIGANVILKPGAWIGEDAVIGDETILNAGVKVYHRCEIGKRGLLHAGVVIGSDGFGFLPDAKGLLKIPQVGRVVIGDDVEIGANSCVDRGTLDDTLIGSGTKIDNLVQIGHNCKLGRNVILCAFVGLSGNTVLEDNVLMAGQAGAKGHLRIGAGTQVGAQSGVSKDIPPNSKVKGYPAIPVNEFLKIQTLVQRLPEIYKRLVAVEKKGMSKGESHD